MASAFNKLSKKQNGCTKNAVHEEYAQVVGSKVKEFNECSQECTEGEDIRDLGIAQCVSTKQLTRRPHLTRTLQQVLKDPSVLVYFIQYMESQDALSLLKFWLASESFEASVGRLVNYSVLSPLSLENTRAPQSHAETTAPEIEEHLKPSSSNNKAICDNTSPNYNSTQATWGYSFSGECLSATGSDDLCQSSANCCNSGSSTSMQVSAFKQQIEKDAYDLFYKYIEKESPHSIGVTDRVREAVRNSICDVNGDLDPQCFSSAREFVFSVLDKRYFPKFLESVYYYKHQINVLTHESVKMSDILYSSTIRDSFMEYLDTVNLLSYLEFLIAAESFRHDLVLSLQSSAYSAFEAQSDAMVLYDRYFSMQATQPISIGNKMRIELENRICREGGPDSDCFDEPMKLVWYFLEQECSSNFVKSEQFKSCLKSLVVAVENHVELPPRSGSRRHMTCGSDSSSDISGASTQSCPAGLTMRKRASSNANPRAMILQQRVQNITTEDLHGSVPYLNVSSPSKKSKGLSFGHVNDFGVYVSEFEGAVVSQKKASPFDRLKKSLNEPKKVKEDNALLAAQSIIEDIQKMAISNDEVSD